MRLCLGVVVGCLIQLGDNIFRPYPLFPKSNNYCSLYRQSIGRHGRDRMIVGFTTTYAIRQTNKQNNLTTIFL